MFSKPAFFSGLLYWGVRLDFTVLFYINCAFFVYYLFIDRYVPRRLSYRICMVLLLAANLPFIAINTIDLAYYGFTGRRSNINLLNVFSDSLSAIPSFLAAYWYLFLFFAAATAALFFILRKIILANAGTAGGKWYVHSLAGLMMLLLFGLAARGLQSRPITPFTPLLYFDAQYQPVASNSSITFLYSLVKRQQQLAVKHYFTNEALDSLYTVQKQYVHNRRFEKRNVVVFILESFCREYFMDGKYRAQTPFLDSLITKSTWCSHAFANGIMSNQGIVSILGSMPSFLQEPYYHSAYNNNRVRGIGSLLKDSGYSTHFFMGAAPDHFGFGKFCNILGIGQYHSQKEFNDDRYYDGNWGIFDHAFLPFAGRVLNQQTSPFLGVFFTISSHYPFTIPQQFREKFSMPGKPPYVNNIAYVDYSLRLFFESIKNASWYKNTVFVFTADHSILGLIEDKYDAFSSYRIPLFIHDPMQPVYRQVDKPVQQLDIIPTILDQLAYSGPFMSFGESIYDAGPGYAVYPYGDLKVITDNHFLLGYSEAGEAPAFLHQIAGDSLLPRNLLHDNAHAHTTAGLLQQLKAVIQRYNNSLIRNELDLSLP